MILEDDFAFVQARGKSPIKAFEGLFEHLLYAEGLYLTQINGGDWIAGLNIKKPTAESEIKWRKHINEQYKEEEHETE